MQKDSNGVDALDRLSEQGWAKKWSSQPYLSCHTVYIHLSITLEMESTTYVPFFLYQTSLRELTTPAIKNADTLAIPSVSNDVSYVYLLVITLGFGKNNVHCD